MELDHFLHKVQGVLKYEQKTLGPLYTLNKDNEKDASKVLESLKQVIDDKEFNNKLQQNLFVLLFLNTDSDIYSVLKKNRNYAHLVGFLPKLSRELFLKLVTGLKLHQHLYDAVQYFSSCLSYQILEICLNALSLIDLFEAVSFVENLLSSLFCKIVVIEDTDQYNSHLKDAFQRLLLHFDAEKGGSHKRMRLWKSHKVKHYGGLVMESMLSLLEKCTKFYCKKDTSPTTDNSICNIQIDQEAVPLKPVVGTESRLINSQQCYEHIVAKCLENVCSITIDLWLFWVEIDLDYVPDTENTLQRRIGETAYTCRETLQQAQSSGVCSKEALDLISRLQSVALKPHSEEDLANSLTLDQVLTNIEDKSKDTKQWLRFLLSNSSFCLEHSALEILKSHLALLKSCDIYKLSNLLFTFIKDTNSENCGHHKTFVLDMVKSVDADSQIAVSKCFVEICGLTEDLKNEEFQSVFMETFNKVLNEEDREKELYPQFLCLALQSAKAVVSKAVAEGITSEVRGHLMADILGRLQPFCDASQAGDNSLLVTALDDLMLSLSELPENQRTNYPLFVRELVMQKTLDGEQFIKGCLMTKLHCNLKTKNWAVLTACLETLSELYDVDCIHNCPASLVMLVQVMQATRWTPSTYNMDAVRVCELTLQLVNQFVTKLLDIGIQDSKLSNLKALVHKCISPLNWYHLYRLLPEEPVPSDPALNLVYRMHYGIGEWSVLQVNPEDRLKLVYALCYVLPVLTSNEWQELFCVAAPKCSEFICLFHIVTDCILLCLHSANLNSDLTVMSCLGFAILNVARVVKYEVSRWTKDDNEYRISVLSKMCQLVSILPQSHQETFGLTLIKVLQQLLPEGSRRKPLTDEEKNRCTASIASIQAPKVRQNLAKEFLEMIHR